MTTIYLATFDSRNFSFSAVDVSLEDARAACLRALRAHTAQYQLASDWYDKGDINVKAMLLGAGYRDGFRVVEPPVNHQLQRTTQTAIAKYGREFCLEAYRMHTADGEGASTLGCYLKMTTQQMDAAINAGRDIVNNDKSWASDGDF